MSTVVPSYDAGRGAGLMTVISEFEVVNGVTAMFPKSITSSKGWILTPWIVTNVPGLISPEDGLTLVM